MTSRDNPFWREEGTSSPWADPAENGHLVLLSISGPMFSVIRRRNWQENQQKATSAIPIRCQLCSKHEVTIKSLKSALETAKAANEERVQDLQKHVESLVLQNENLVKTIQKLLMCQNNAVETPKILRANKQESNEATVKVEEKIEKKQNEAIKLMNRGKTGVVGPQIANKIKKVTEGVKNCVRKRNYGAKASPKAHNKGKAKKSVSPEVAIEGKTVKVILEKIDGDITNTAKKQVNSNKDVHYVSSDDEMDSELSMWTLEDTDDEDQTIDVIGLDSDLEANVKTDVPQNGTEPTYKICLWVDSVGGPPCSRMFKNSSDLGNHLRRCHRPKGRLLGAPCLWRSCPRNGKMFSRRDTLDHHIYKHTGERPFTCKLPGCGRTFTKKYYMKRHACRAIVARKGRPPKGVTISHVPNSKPESPQPLPFHAIAPPPSAVRAKHKHHWCRFPRCGKKFATSKSLKQHQDNVHCPEPRFRCSTCRETFLHNGDLERHELAHRDETFAYADRSRSAHAVAEKRYRCMHPNCDRLLSSSAALRKHEQTHSGREPYRCSFPTCGRRFLEKGSVKKHLLRMHTGNRCRLEGCDERFANRLLCVEHQLRVHMHLFLNRNADYNGLSETPTVPEESDDAFGPGPQYELPGFAGGRVEVKRERADSLEEKGPGGFTTVAVKTEKVDLPEMDISYEDESRNYEKMYSDDDNSYEIEVNYEKAVLEDEAEYDIVTENVKYLDVQNGFSDADADSVVAMDNAETILTAVPDIWRIPK